MGIQSGATRQALTKRQIELFQVPVPELHIQDNAASRLDAVQSEVDRMRSVLDENEQLLDQLERSILERAFRGEL
jgi:type I restriction enzyme, S subunit